MKQTNLEEIKNEEKRFFGFELEEPEISSQLNDHSGMDVKWLYPIQDTYFDWIGAAIHACLATWEQYPYATIDNMTLEEQEKRLLNVLEERPISVALEMPKFAFKITGLSRAMTHQIVRHRTWAFGQQSIRVADTTGAPTRKPKNLSPEIEKDYNEVVTATKKMYKQLVNLGIPREQARNILPIGTTTSIVCTADLRSLIEYFKSRTLDITQGEHHYMVYLIAKTFKEHQPKFFEFTCSKVNGLKELVESDADGI